MESLQGGLSSRQLNGPVFNWLRDRASRGALRVAASVCPGMTLNSTGVQFVGTFALFTCVFLLVLFSIFGFGNLDQLSTERKSFSGWTGDPLGAVLKLE